jgi:hypothetical protein
VLRRLRHHDQGLAARQTSCLGFISTCPPSSTTHSVTLRPRTISLFHLVLRLESTPSRPPALLSLISASASTAGIPELYYLSSSRLPSLNLTSTRHSVLSTTHPLVSTYQPVSSTISVRILSRIGQTAHILAVPREHFHSSLRRLRYASDRSSSYFQRPSSSYSRSTESPTRNTTIEAYALHKRATSSSSTQLVSNFSTIRFQYYSPAPGLKLGKTIGRGES